VGFANDALEDDVIKMELLDLVQQAKRAVDGDEACDFAREGDKGKSE
jgi:hypothetical protein